MKIIYNHMYPFKVWLTGLAITSIFTSFAEITLNDFSPYFVALFLNILACIPPFFIFYIVFLILKGQSLSHRPAKNILIAVSGLCLLEYGIILMVPRWKLNK